MDDDGPVSDAERFLLKDLLNQDSIGVIAAAVAAVHPAFDRQGFLRAVFDGQWAGRELKQRMRHVAEELRTHLPPDYRDAVEVLVAASPATAGAGFAAMALSDVVEAFGLDDPDASIPALEALTKVVSAEFAVRPFIDRYPDRMWGQLLEWAGSDDPAVRRLASEGSRPRLPWGMRLRSLIADPGPVRPVLEALCHDPSEDVRRSVANHLNDIAKDHPQLVMAWLEQWQDASCEVEQITRHALRTLLKQGDPRALRLLGYDPEPRIDVRDLQVDPPCVTVGSQARLGFVVVSTGEHGQHLVIDAVVYFVKTNGARSPKVFRLRTAQLAPGEHLVVRRRLSFAQMSTRTVHPGTHAIDVQVNGAVQRRIEFEVVAPGEERSPAP